MFNIEVAGLTVCIRNRFDYAESLCRDYIVPDDRIPDITVEVSEEELRREMDKSPELFFGDGYGEGICLYEKLSCALPAFDAFVMHSSVLAVDGNAYCFAAESGVGKSTHTRFWKELLGDRVTVINGDKPIYRFTGDQLMAYGTPWCGKENWHTNTSAPLKALCLLERGEENAIRPVDGFELLGELTRHFYLPGGGQVDMLKMMELIDRTLETVPVYRLTCRKDISAAGTASGVLLGEDAHQFVRDGILDVPSIFNKSAK